MSHRPAVALVIGKPVGFKNVCIILLLFMFLLFSRFLDSPHRGPDHSEAAGCSTAPDSSTVCASSSSAPHPGLEEEDIHISQTPCTLPVLHTQPSAAMTPSSASHLALTAAHPLLPSKPALSSISRCKPSLPSSSCPTMSPSLSPSLATSSNQTPCLGQRRKGLVRKMRRSQRQCGRQSCGPSARDAEREESEDAGGEERMEEDIEQDEDRMEEETCAETAGLQQ